MSASIFKRVGAVALLHDESAGAGDIASQDVFTQMDAIEEAVRARGAVVTRHPTSINLWALKRWLKEERPGLIVNLVESLDKSDRLQTLVPLVLEDWRIPFTGTRSNGMLLANNKLLAKARLAERGIPVADSVWADRHGRVHHVPEPATGEITGDWIIKTVESHASLHMDDDSVLRSPSRDELVGRILDLSERHGQRFFGERFIDGREFNLSLMEDGAGGVDILPPSEIVFAKLPAGKPAIVGYNAKWDESSPEYGGTAQSFEFTEADAPLLEKLKKYALGAWEAIGLSGYARVDFRVDAEGVPYVLEANANPCLSPDAGFAASARRAGMEYADMVERIATAALR